MATAVQERDDGSRRSAAALAQRAAAKPSLLDLPQDVVAALLNEYLDAFSILAVRATAALVRPSRSSHQKPRSPPEG
jgi:hypothetical protein